MLRESGGGIDPPWNYPTPIALPDRVLATAANHSGALPDPGLRLVDDAFEIDRPPHLRPSPRPARDPFGQGS
jgi:hypothetical protein